VGDQDQGCAAGVGGDHDVDARDGDEDDDVDAMGIERAIKKSNYPNPFFRAKDGIEALELLRANGVDKPFLILLDLNMPRMSGLEMLTILREDPDLTRSVIFVLTTSDDDQDKLAAYSSHIAGYIVKNNLDTNFSELMQLIDNYRQVVELPNDET